MQIKKFIKNYFMTTSVLLVAVLPSSSNYTLESYGFGAGGEAGMSSSNFSLEAILGESSGDQSSTTYSVKSGLIFMQEANVPTATLTNDSNWYNKLNVVVGEENNPSDAQYAI